MRLQNVIIFSSGKNKRVAHEIARGLDGDVCKAVVWDEFFNKIYGEEYTLTKSYALFPFLIKKIPSFDYAIIVAGDDDRMRTNEFTICQRRFLRHNEWRRRFWMF